MCKKLLSILLAVSMLCSAALAITDEEFEQLTGVDINSLSYDAMVNMQANLQQYISKMTECEQYLADRIVAHGVVDYTSMTLDDALAAIALVADDTGYGSCTTRAIDTTDPSVIYVDVNLKIVDSENALNDSVRYVCTMAQSAFTRSDVPMMYFRFYEPGRDAKGNSIDLMTITVRLTADTAAEMDLDYFAEFAAAQKGNFFKAVDGYSLYKDYKRMIK